MKTIDHDVGYKTTRSASNVRRDAILGLLDELGPLWVTGLALLVFLPAKHFYPPDFPQYNTLPHLLLGSLFPALGLALCAIQHFAGKGFSRVIQLSLAVTAIAIIAYFLQNGFLLYPFVLALLQSIVLLALPGFAEYWRRLRARVAASDQQALGLHPTDPEGSLLARVDQVPVLVGFLVSFAAWAVTLQYLQGHMYEWAQVESYEWTKGKGFEQWVGLSRYTIPVLLLSLLLVAGSVYSASPGGAKGQSRFRLRFPNRLENLLAVVVLALVSFRSNQFAGDFPAGFDGDYMAYYHWNPLVSTIDCVRQGGWLLWDVPSQYGFLNMWIFAGIPSHSAWQALYLGNGAILFGSAALLYFALRTLGRGFLNWCFALATTVGPGLLLPGLSRDFTGPQIWPHNGALRFLGVYALLGVLLWDFYRFTRHRGSRLTLWLGNAAWLFGVLWSFDSAVMCTMIWLPAYSLLLWRDAVTLVPKGRRLGPRILYVMKWLLLPGLLLVLAVGTLTAYYFLVLGHAPDWYAFVEFAFAWASKYPGWSSDSVGPWIGFVIACAVATAALYLVSNKRVESLGLVWGAWGAFWCVFSYAATHCDHFNVTCLTPLTCLIAALVLHLLARERSAGKLTYLVKTGLIPVFAVLLAAAFGRLELIPKVARDLRVGSAPLEAALPVMDDAALTFLEATPPEKGVSLILWNDPLLLAEHQRRVAAQDGQAQPHDWVPLLNLEVAADVLPEERLRAYLQRWVGRVRGAGYLLVAKTHASRWTPDREWFMREIGATHTCSPVSADDNYELLRFDLKAVDRAAAR
jgi:hypothetical protein